VSDIEIIPYNELALPFVCDSYSNSLGSAAREPGADWRCACISQPAARAWLKTQLEHVRLAVPRGRPEVYVGWCLVVGHTLEYVYVKHAARRFGVAKELLSGQDIRHVGMTTWPWTREYAQRMGWV
jgi:hypothetical protein